MKEKNTESLGAYIFENIICSFGALIWYRFFFRIIPGRTYVASKTVLCVLVVVCVSLGVFLTYKSKRRRSLTSLIVNVLLPFEIYTVITYFSDFRTLSIMLLLVVGGLGTAYFVHLFKRKMPEHIERSVVVRKRVCKGILGLRTMAAILMLGIMIPIATCLVLSDSLFPNTEEATIGIEAKECTIENNIETVRNIRQELWEDLSVSEKIRTLQVIANIEARSLGLPHELNVNVESMDDDTFAGYLDPTHSIIININYFNRDAAEIVDALCHEAYHAYQHRYVEAYESLDDEYKNLKGFSAVRYFENEFANYQHGQEDFESYYLQHCESSARIYAADAVAEYLKLIGNDEVPQ